MTWHNCVLIRRKCGAAAAEGSSPCLCSSSFTLMLDFLIPHVQGRMFFWSPLFSSSASQTFFQMKTSFYKKMEITSRTTKHHHLSTSDSVRIAHLL
ncbi:hypothetical protein ILYODFUR_029038 [Ilyodon furcidens]|uniref:Uncharacterized protein n=1 Tax=Ilyodon furcidens TaxID=33524 RepID=A0ABV0TML3_9TELE